jgi:transcription initiation factor TFIIB
MNERQQAALVGMMDALDAPETVRELAHAVAHRAFAAELQMGRSVEAIAASAVYAAFREAGAARTLSDLSEVTGLNRTHLGRLYRHLADELDLEVAPVDPHEFVSRYAGPLEVSEKTEARAHEIVAESVEAGLLSGVKSAGVAAGGLYLAAREHNHLLSQREVTAVADVDATTLRHRCGEQTALLGVDEYGSITPNRRKLFDGD